MATSNMLLTLPTVSVTIGPEWATELNVAIETIDAHDHSSDKGARITPAGLNINANLDIENYIFYNFAAIRFQETGAALTGSSNANALYSVSGNLYFTNGSGNAVQVTSGGSIAASPGSADSFETTSVSTNLTIGPSDTFVYLVVDTSAARSIDLPLAANVSDGRIYIIKDANSLSETNNITVNIQGSDTIDGAASQILTSNSGSWTIVGDGVSAWYIS
jgi:hypothetical protein